MSASRHVRVYDCCFRFDPVSPSSIHDIDIVDMIVPLSGRGGLGIQFSYRFLRALVVGQISKQMDEIRRTTNSVKQLQYSLVTGHFNVSWSRLFLLHFEWCLTWFSNAWVSHSTSVIEFLIFLHAYEKDERWILICQNYLCPAEYESLLQDISWFSQPIM